MLRVAMLAVALVLAGTGLWLATIQALSYLAIMKNDRMERVVQLNENGVPALHLCDGLTCRPYGEIQRQYLSYFAIDAFIFPASSGLVGLLFVWRGRIKAKSIV